MYLVAILRGSIVLRTHDGTQNSKSPYIPPRRANHTWFWLLLLFSYSLVAKSPVRGHRTGFSNSRVEEYLRFLLSGLGVLMRDRSTLKLMLHIVRRQRIRRTLASVERFRFGYDGPDGVSTANTAHRIQHWEGRRIVYLFCHWYGGVK